MNATFLDPCVLPEARILASARPDPPSTLSPSWGAQSANVGPTEPRLALLRKQLDYSKLTKRALFREM